MKILVIQNRMGIGDMVIFLPFIDAIAKKYNCPINILVKENSKASQILNDNKNSRIGLFLECNAASVCGIPLPPTIWHCFFMINTASTKNNGVKRLVSG